MCRILNCDMQAQLGEWVERASKMGHRVAVAFRVLMAFLMSFCQHLF